MPTAQSLPVKDLSLDLHNFRMPNQANEFSAVRSMISVNPDWFWALAHSILDDGYLSTENVLILQSGKRGAIKTVKEGNRRVAILKLALGHIRLGNLDIPTDIEQKVKDLSDGWKATNSSVPCAIYAASEKDLVDKIVTLTHGKGEKAGRDKWKAVARARHNREMGGASEPALDLLEKYLKHGNNLTDTQKQRWGGDYPLTVLEEAMKRIAARVGGATAREMADQYPSKTKHKKGVDKMLLEIGTEELSFADIRDKNKDFALTRYGIPAIQPAQGNAGTTTSQTGTASSSTSTTTAATAAGTTSGATGKPHAVATHDSRAVTRELKGFKPVGNNRNKLVTLLEEARTLKLGKHPHAFCFLLRSMFEISAKAYCKDHAKSAGGPSATKKSGEERALVDILRDITTHLTKNNTDKAMVKVLHGAMAEMGKANGFLSVTSMNQLVHNPSFTVDETHISTLFGNIFPLLAAMNA